MKLCAGGELNPVAIWGERLHRSGAAPRPIPAKRLTAERLTEALEAILVDSSIGQTAVELGRSLTAEDGVGRAVEVIEGYLAPSTRGSGA